MNSLAAVAKHVRAGGIVIYPTDTAYAIGCVFNNRSAIRRIMQFKGRTDPKFTLIAASLEQVEKHFRLNSVQRALAKKYWPGPLSIVVNKKFAVRVPDEATARSLAKQVGAPLLATSFNKTGEAAIYSLDSRRVNLQLIASLPDDAVIINAGRLQKRKPSTVVEVKRQQIHIHRKGPIHV